MDAIDPYTHSIAPKKKEKNRGEPLTAIVHVVDKIQLVFQA